MSAKNELLDAKKNVVSEDLHGLLRFCKHKNTYFAVYVSKEQKKIVLVIADNPACFNSIPKDDLQSYIKLSRSDMNIKKYFINYLDPEHIIYNYGQTLGIHFPLNNIVVKNLLSEKTKRYFLIEGPIKFLPDILTRLRELIEMKPQVKYEIIEKYIVSNS